MLYNAVPSIFPEISGKRSDSFLCPHPRLADDQNFIL